MSTSRPHRKNPMRRMKTTSLSPRWVLSPILNQLAKHVSDSSWKYILQFSGEQPQIMLKETTMRFPYWVPPTSHISTKINYCHFKSLDIKVVYYTRLDDENIMWYCSNESAYNSFIYFMPCLNHHIIPVSISSFCSSSKDVLVGKTKMLNSKRCCILAGKEY